jgi:microcystin-dependent protein
LFSLIGTNYGGDGRTTFALPNLSGRVVVGQGSGPGLTPRAIGQSSGSETTTLTVRNMPPHNHDATLNAESTGASASDPTGALLAQAQTYAPAGRAQNAAMSNEAITVASNGGGQSFNNMQPFLVMNYQIALVGIFPSRS